MSAPRDTGHGHAPSSAQVRINPGWLTSSHSAAQWPAGQDFKWWKVFVQSWCKYLWGDHWPLHWYVAVMRRLLCLSQRSCTISWLVLPPPPAAPLTSVITHKFITEQWQEALKQLSPGPANYTPTHCSLPIKHHNCPRLQLPVAISRSPCYKCRIHHTKCGVGHITQSWAELSWTEPLDTPHSLSTIQSPVIW